MSADDVGRCGDAAPELPGTGAARCALPAGHPGWHRGDDGAEWNAELRTPPAWASAAEAQATGSVLLEVQQECIEQRRRADDAEAEAMNLSHDYDRRGDRLWRLAAKAGYVPSESDNDATAELVVSQALDAAVGAEAWRARLASERGDFLLRAERAEARLAAVEAALRFGVHHEGFGVLVGSCDIRAALAAPTTDADR